MRNLILIWLSQWKDLMEEQELNKKIVIIMNLITDPLISPPTACDCICLI